MKDRFWLQLIVLGVVLRLIFASFLFHTDLKNQYHEAQLLNQGIVAGFAQGVKDNTPLHYPPPIYLLYNVYPKFGHFLFSSYFDQWMNDWSSLHVVNHPAIFRDLLVMKLPLLIFDLLVSWLLVQMVPLAKRKTVGLIWFLNPFSLYAIYAFGQFDIIPTFLMVLSVYFWRRGKISSSYLALGLAAGVKVFPIMLLPFYLILDPGNLRQKTTGLFLSLIGFGICLVPIITSTVALKSVFLSNLTGGMFQASIPLGGSMYLPIYMVGYVGLLIALLSGSIKKPTIESIIFIVLATLLGLSDFHPQWMVWVMPFLTLLIADGVVGWKEALGMMLGYIGLSLLINDNFVSIGLFKAINNAFDSLGSLRDLIDKLGLGQQLQGLANAFFVVMIGWIDLEILKKVKTRFEIKVRTYPIWKFGVGWMVTLICLFILIHIPLMYLGRYIDTNMMEEQARIPLKGGTIITQNIPVTHNGFSEIQVKMKNIYLQNKQEYYFTISDDNGNVVKSYVISGNSIGDDFDLDLRFPTQTNSANRTYTLKIDAPTQVAEGNEIIVPFNANAGETGLVVNNKPISGRIAYMTFYRLNSLGQNINYSLKNIFTKLLVLNK